MVSFVLNRARRVVSFAPEHFSLSLSLTLRRPASAAAERLSIVTSEKRTTKEANVEKKRERKKVQSISSSTQMMIF